MKRNAKQSLLDDPKVWGAIVAAKFAREIGLPVGNYWEPRIARALTALVLNGDKTRDEIELQMAFQLGIARTR